MSYYVKLYDYQDVLHLVTTFHFDKFNELLAFIFDFAAAVVVLAAVNSSKCEVYICIHTQICELNEIIIIIIKMFINGKKVKENEKEKKKK